MSTVKYPANISKIDLLKLSIPVFFSNLAIPLVGIVDTGLMGHLENEKFLVATSISTSVMTMILWSFGFLRMGTTGLVAQSLGKGDYREIVSIVLRNFSLVLIISLTIIILKSPIVSLINQIFNSTTETSILIDKYISIRVLSAPAELIIYILVGFYLGLQKTNISSLAITFFSLMNILLSSYFVLQMNLNIEGVVLGTLISAYLTAVIFTIYTYFFIIKKFNIIPRFKKVFVKKKMLKLFNINFDIFIRTILLTFAFFWITYQSSKFGEDYIAANAILMQFILFSSFFLDAFAFSTEGVVGFALGRRGQNSFLNSVRNSFELSFLTSLIISIFFLIFFKSIVNILTDLEIVRYLSYGFIFWIIIIPPVASFCYQFDGIFVGTSHTSEMRNAMIISVASFIFLSIYFVKLLQNHGLWFSLLLFMLIRSLTLFYYFPKILKKF